MLRQLLFRRGVHSALQAQQYLNAEGSLFDPFILKDMPVAVDRIIRALQQGEKIVVYGDYDADGITATALLVQWLRYLNGNVQEYIPDRFTEGYGLNLDAMQTLHDLDVKLIITVDCGIRSIEEIALATELGMDVIISDHHWPEEELPPALAIICPKQDGDEYPEKNLAGVGIAYKIAEALAARLSHAHEEVDEYLDLVALGTVADLADLTGENRAMVRKGLSLLRSGSRLGVRALAGAANVDLSRINARSIGFMLAPRLNAAGRLETAQSAYQILITRDDQEAGLLAQRLDDQNKDRQRITREIQQAVMNLTPDEEFGFLVCARDEKFQSGVVGLAASRLVEHYYRPAIVGTKNTHTTRASCRSINEFNITAALDACSELLEHHGGHHMAAGFTVKNENWDELITRLQKIAENQLKDQELQQSYTADSVLEGIEQVTELLKRSSYGNIYDLSDILEPTGMGNSEVIFIARNLTVKDCRAVGEDKSHLKLVLGGENRSSAILDGIAFRQGHWIQKSLIGKKLDILFKFEKNTFQGVEKNQLNISDIRYSE